MLSSFNLLVLHEVPRIGRRSVSFIAEVGYPSPDSSSDYLEIFHAAKKNNTRIKIPTIDEIENAISKANNICDTSEKEGIKIIGCKDDLFPDTLKTIPDPPVLLYTKGNVEILKSETSVALIGTREPTNFGYASGKQIAKVLTKQGFIIVSGLALGCDTAGHEGCLEEGGKTIAVLAHGLDKIYPAKNKELASEIIKSSGCLISEYAPGVRARSNFFVDRDRLQSGLSNAVFVVETAIKGGTLHTVKFCIEQGRILATLAHPEKHLLGNKKAEGNQMLISEKGAMPVSDKESLQEFIKRIIDTKNIDNSSYLIKKKVSNNGVQLSLDF